MFDLILFDVDGVFLSEERCFDASALTVWELLYGPHFLHLKGEQFSALPTEKMIQHIRREVFQQDTVLDWMKDRGINANWDMVYLVFSAQLMLLLRDIAKQDQVFVAKWLAEPITEQSLSRLREKMHLFTPDFPLFTTLFDEKVERLNREQLLTYFNGLAKEWFNITIDHFSRSSELWELGRSVYQEWYLGEKLYKEVESPPRTDGKQGFLYQEIPLASVLQLQELLTDLQASGITLGIGTGRPLLETEVPFQEMGLMSFFDSHRIITATDVVRAETQYPVAAPLGKPDPFTYVRGFLGKMGTDETALALPLPIKDGHRVLVVGDSVADFLAARQLGCRFAATLTGLTGQKARSKFEELGADYILDDVLQLRSVILG
jgi:phosphoglycolate phosphatase-like HAD superfamily hydrolase